MAKVQIIRDAKGTPAFAVVPWKEYVRIARGDAEDLEDAAAAEAAMTDPDRYPAEVAQRMLAGENTLKVIREWRGLTQQELADKSGRVKQYISQLETGTRKIGRKTARVLAPPLRVSPEALLD
jgi:DNA-binding XRE family transcriptional regulator